jgi:hypothetical protein
MIKIRADLYRNDLYLIVEKIIKNLENIFGEYDKMANCDIKVYNLKFQMGIVNIKEIFDEFYTHFLFAVVLLDYSDIHKIFLLKRNLNNRFRYKLVDGFKINLYKKLILRCR